MACAISSGWPTRPAGTLAAMPARMSSGVWSVDAALASANPVKRAVCVAPGNTLFTVMPWMATSVAHVFAQLATAPRTVFDTPKPASGALTEVLMTLTIRPQPSAFIPGKTACAKSWLFTKCWRYVSSNASTRASVMGPPDGPPVLFTKMWTGWAWTISPTAAPTATLSVKSATATRCPSPGNVVRAEFSRSSFRASNVTTAPSPASCRAVAKPIPWEAPHTSACLPVKSSGRTVGSYMQPKVAQA